MRRRRRGSPAARGPTENPIRLASSRMGLGTARSVPPAISAGGSPQSPRARPGAKTSDLALDLGDLVHAGTVEGTLGLDRQRAAGDKSAVLGRPVGRAQIRFQGVAAADSDG